MFVFDKSIIDSLACNDLDFLIDIRIFVNQIVPKVCKLRKLCVFDENYHISTEKLNNLIKQNAPTLQYLELSADNKLEGNF